jgi:hypothetical protein
LLRPQLKGGSVSDSRRGVTRELRRLRPTLRCLDAKTDAKHGRVRTTPPKGLRADRLPALDDRTVICIQAGM